jgi:FixJ family two-component response regulator
VLQLVVEGRANKVIALDLGLSERTVEVHRGNIMDKMGAQSLAHLVRMHMIIQSGVAGS